MSTLIPIIVLYLYFTNCSVVLEEDHLTFRRIFPPYLEIATFDFKNINAIDVVGIGSEQQISSDKKWITVEANNQRKSYRCDGYINHSEETYLEQPTTSPLEDFTVLRTSLKTICQTNNISYSEQ
jgi:hypothetical protein